MNKNIKIIKKVGLLKNGLVQCRKGGHQYVYNF